MEACETPLPWEEETATKEDDRLDREVEQLLWDSDWEDDEDCLDSQRSYSGWEHGYDADSGWRAAARVAACGATRVMATTSATRAREEAAQLVKAAGPRDEEEGAAWKSAYLDAWADMKARVAQGMPVHGEVAQMLARSARVLEEAAQAAETAGTATPSQTGQDVPAAKAEKLTVGGMSPSTAATTTDEERRAARKVAYLTLVADSCCRDLKPAGRPLPHYRGGNGPPSATRCLRGGGAVVDSKNIVCHVNSSACRVCAT